MLVTYSPYNPIASQLSVDHIHTESLLPKMKSISRGYRQELLVSGHDLLLVG